MKCSNRSCPYPTVSRSGNMALCETHMRRIEPIGSPTRGTVTESEHDRWCDGQNLEHESVMRNVRKRCDRRLNEDEIGEIRDVFRETGNRAEVRRRTGFNSKSITKYTADLRGAA